MKEKKSFKKSAWFPSFQWCLGASELPGSGAQQSHRWRGKSLGSKVWGCGGLGVASERLVLKPDLKGFLHTGYWFLSLSSHLNYFLKDSLLASILGTPQLSTYIWMSQESQPPPPWESVVLFPSSVCFLYRMILKDTVQINEFEISSRELPDWDFSSIIYINCSLALCSAICYLPEGT